jgi:hypothetical protein
VEKFAGLVWDGVPECGATGAGTMVYVSERSSDGGGKEGWLEGD